MPSLPALSTNLRENRFPTDSSPAAWDAHRAALAGKPRPPSCPSCKGTGWLITSFEALTKSGARATDVLVRCAVCGHDSQQQWMRRHCGMEPREQAYRLPFWRTPALSKQQQAQRTRARAAMVDAIQRRAGLFTFWGDFGGGKTLALQVVVNEIREAHSVEGYYAPLASILSHLRSLYNAKADTSDYWQRLLDVPVLALDEVTRFRSDSQWQQEQLFVLVDTRYRRRDTHLTLFATNDDPRASLPPEEAIGYLLSRMREGTLCELRGDVRQAVGGTP